MSDDDFERFRVHRNKTKVLIRNSKREFAYTQLDSATVGSTALWRNVRKFGLSKSSDEQLTSFTPDEFNLNFVGSSVGNISTFTGSSDPPGSNDFFFVFFQKCF